MPIRIIQIKCGIASRLLCSGLVAMLALVSGTAFADDQTGSVSAGGVSVYYAVLPAEMIRGYPKGSAEFTMHGGPPSGTHRHHVMVALFDGKTLARIADAEVEASVAEVGLAGTAKMLEPMPISGAVTYGNYFYFSNLATYRITIEIWTAGSAKAIETWFDYKHH